MVIKKKSKKKSRKKTRRSKKRGGSRVGFDDPTPFFWSFFRLFYNETTQQEYENLIERRMQEYNPEYYNRDARDFRSRINFQNIVLPLIAISTYYYFIYNFSDSDPSELVGTEETEESRTDLMNGLRVLAEISHISNLASGDTTAFAIEGARALARNMGDQSN